MNFSVLGSLEVTDDKGRQLELGGVKQRAILGYLVLNANKVVPTSRILQAMWEDEPPPTARKMVQNAVSGIRRLLPGHRDLAPALQTRPPGYQLRVATGTIDLYRFRSLVREGREAITAGAAEQGAEQLCEALSLWRGRALADLVETGICWSELAAIEDERLSALEDRLDAELACGRHREITPELEVLTATEPLRERLCVQFMLALYRSGRQADALTVYRRTRGALIDGLGLEPGRGLQELHQRILEHDATIQVPVLASH